eukprot:gene31437-40834_t
MQKLAQFSTITGCLICGGKKDIKLQETVICTPGRILDHLRNSHSVTLDDLDVLVLDEVDKLLDMGFQEEVEELVRHCPLSRQTMLFSATMTAKVEDLAKLSLKRPIRVKTAAPEMSRSAEGGEGGGKVGEFAPRLVQEFIKVRKQDEVEAILASLICRSFGNKTIVFYETKKDAHRFCKVLQLLGKKVSELHGDIAQAARYAALQAFRDGLVDVMVATGLDIPGVQTVINSEMPRNTSTYVHRVGSDARRKIMKDVLKDQANASAGKADELDKQVLSRAIPQQIVAFYVKKISGLEPELQELFKQTETQKQLLREANKEIVKKEIEAARVDPVQSAAEKAAALALSDDYRMQEKDDKRKKKLPRKQRRKLEAMKDLEDDNDEDEGEVKKSSVKKNLELAPKRAKKRDKKAVERPFTDFDPNKKLRKGINSAFKSKKKYKRRK